MKKLLFACASLMLISSAMAADGADVKINGEIRARFSGQENAGFTENSWDNRTEQRTKLGFTFTKSEDLTAQVTLLARGEWGNGADTNTSGELENDSQSEVVVYEAWAFWKAMDNVSVKLGRGALDLADGTIVSKNDYEQNPYSFEGIAVMYFHELVNLSVFAVKGMNDGESDDEEDGAGTSGTADVNFYAAAADFKVAPEYLKTFNVMALQSKATGIDAVAADDADEKLRLSLTLAGDTNGVDYRGTYAMYTGEYTTSAANTSADHKASMMDLEVGYTLKDIMNLRVSALYHSDSGDSNPNDGTANKGDIETYDSFFYNKHDNAGKMDIIGWGNSTYIKLGVSLEPMEMLTAGVDYYMFQKSEENDGVYSPVGDTLGNAATASGDDVGSEIDLWVKKVLSNGAEIRAHYGMFQADDALGTNAEDVSEMEVSATFRF